MKIQKSFLVACLCVLALNVAAQKSLEKPFSEWSKSEANKIANESAWAKVHQPVAPTAAAEGSQIAREMGRGGGNPGSISRTFGVLPVTIRLHSAPVVRQAIVRLQQFGSGYDKMSEAEKAAFDAGRKGFLDCAICQNYYVVTLTKAIDSSGESVNDAIFQSMTLEEMKGKVRLENDKGEVRELFQFTAPKGPGDSAIFFFKRTDEQGKLLISPESKELRFVFDSAFLKSGSRDGALLPRVFDFKVSKMIVNNEVMF